MDNFNLKITDFGQINQANINLKKINVVGGVNGSGKSTAVKILYCFLNAMSETRNEYILEYILPDINSVINRMARPMDDNISSEFNYTSDDDLNEILIKFNNARNIFSSMTLPEDGWDDMFEKIEKYLSIILDEHNTSYSPVVKILFENESLLDFNGNAMFYNNSFKCSVNYFPFESTFKDSVFLREQLKEKDIQYDDFDERFVYKTDGNFEFLKDVLYVDNVSIFDLDYFINTRNSVKQMYSYKQHLIHLLNQLRVDKSPDLPKELLDNIGEVNEKIREIIGGESSYSTLFKIGNIKEDTYSFKHGDKKFRINISSGIQQLSVIQILLQNRKLIPGTFLIIDEPEVNLHPEWQIKYAQILVLLAKELDVIIYLNSHSPMFIEAMSLYSQYYDLLDDTNFYLTHSLGNGKYDFININPKDMGAVYENLTRPYDDLDKLKAKILFKE